MRDCLFNDGRATRRTFLKASSTAAITGGVTARAQTTTAVHPGRNDIVRVGLIGCGGRGTGAASQALQADENVKLSVMADAFEDRLQLSLANLQKKSELAPKIDVPAERQFVGFDAFKQVMDSDVDVVLLTAPPHFRPLHLKAAIEAGKHVFAEKPVAVDAPGVRSVLQSCQQARGKQLSVVSGLCLRYNAGFQETIKRLHDGEIGEIHTLLANDYRGPIWVKPRQPDWTDMHWQMRNWYYFTWLSGDFNVEQHVHFLDVCAWVMQGYPHKAVGLGGRQVRTGAEFGNIFDHHSVVYEYENGARLISNCRQQSGCFNNVSSQVQGSKGRAVLSQRVLQITSEDDWKYRGESKNMYQVEHDVLFKAIRTGQPINNGHYMAYTTLLAIMGRMATYTGQDITWDQALNSTEDLTPENYAWGPAPEVQIARPGVTPFV